MDISLLAQLRKRGSLSRRPRKPEWRFFSPKMIIVINQDDSRERYDRDTGRGLARYLEGGAYLLTVSFV